MSKRKASQPLDETEKLSKKVKLTVQKKEVTDCYFYESLTSKLLTPHQAVTTEDMRNILVRRNYRSLTGFTPIDIPQLDERETLIYLEKLFRFYAKEKKPKIQRELTTEKLISAKERAFASAADYLFEGKMTCLDIAKLTSLKKHEVEHLEKRILTHREILPIVTSRRKKLSTLHLDFLKELLKQEKGYMLTLNLIRRRLLQEFNDIETISLGTIGKALHNEGFTYKKVSPQVENRNFPDTKSKRKIAGSQLVYCLAQKKQIIFVDETSIKMNVGPEYGWGEKGKRICQRVKKEKLSYTVIAAITDSAVLGCQILKGGTKSEDYTGFLCSLINAYGYKQSSTEIVVFADNASIHHSYFVRSVLGNQITFLFNAPYSPMLNPIEEFFSKFKALVKKEICTNEKQLLQAIQNALQAFTAKDFRGYIRDTLRSIYLSFDEKDL